MNEMTVKSKATGVEMTINRIDSKYIYVSTGVGEIKVSVDNAENVFELTDEIRELIKSFVQKKPVSNNSSTRKQNSSYIPCKKDPNIKDVVFCNIAYMKDYMGITPTDKPYNGGKYVGEQSDAGEKYNFLKGKDGYTRGFVEPGFTKGGYMDGKQRRINIDNINNAARNEDMLNDVVVVMCALSPHTKNTVVVGFYEHATVYRNVLIEQIEGEKRWITFICKNEDAHLIKENERYYVVPRAKTDGYGFGQSNIWYANDEHGVEYKKELLKYLNIE